MYNSTPLRSKTFIEGDIMNIEDKPLIGNNTQISNKQKIKKSIKSIKKFKVYIENSNYHGISFNNNPNKKNKELILGDLND